MNTPRFFCDQTIEPETEMVLPEAIAHHIRVRRLRAQELITLFDGSGSEYLAKLSFTADGQALAYIVSSQCIDRELQSDVTLVQGVASQDRMDWIIEKAVEIGVRSLIPVSAARSVVKLKDERERKRLAHWRRIIHSASEQCGRNKLMQLHTVLAIEDAVATLNHHPKLLCQPDHHSATLWSDSIMEQVCASGGATLIIGPEGGWSDHERTAWVSAGAQAVSLGPRILRTETAGIYATSVLSALLSRNKP
jgi:16S rRNA (uracil1498-N3)-methyltransferase